MGYLGRMPVHHYRVLSPKTIEATTEIKSSFLNARTLGQKQLEEFVEKRLMLAAQSTPQKSFHDPIPKNNALVFASVYEVGNNKKQKEKETVMKKWTVVYFTD